MKIENKKRFIIKRLNGTEKDYAIDEDEIIYIGSRYEQLRACIGNVNNCEEAKDDQ